MIFANGLITKRATRAPVTPAIPLLGKGKVEHREGGVNDCPRCNLSEWVRVQVRAKLAQASL